MAETVACLRMAAQDNNDKPVVFTQIRPKQPQSRALPQNVSIVSAIYKIRITSLRVSPRTRLSVIGEKHVLRHPGMALACGDDPTHFLADQFRSP